MISKKFYLLEFFNDDHDEWLSCSGGYFDKDKAQSMLSQLQKHGRYRIKEIIVYDFI